ncbi:putative N-acetyltransferase YsnE [Oxobacter pfennigii]|uniref:Putative N-acetyltransferase YsnE n=1 Tax=Oxobacter pfennigii TaxID=36849 RepID=A0A0P8Y7F0_9CLOT|nr:GNAT family N-acetyltransferase [Oxobacter pfennigii]KPU42402.1 putative N-acetyltransferase YsnE [Oxobacter pfennigii]
MSLDDLKIIISLEQPDTFDAVNLTGELSEVLKSITGDSGRNSFNPDDVKLKRSVFVVARDSLGNAIGCGALRPIDENIAEVKRMYVRKKHMGCGSKILSYLEDKAREFNYSALWLETRLINNNAVSFYERNGYKRIKNYGKYIDYPQSVCFEKKL